jgi:hypothetical protein
MPLPKPRFYSCQKRAVIFVKRVIFTIEHAVTFVLCHRVAPPLTPRFDISSHGASYGNSIVSIRAGNSIASIRAGNSIASIRADNSIASRETASFDRISPNIATFRLYCATPRRHLRLAVSSFAHKKSTALIHTHTQNARWHLNPKHVLHDSERSGAFRIREVKDHPPLPHIALVDIQTQTCVVLRR